MTAPNEASSEPPARAPFLRLEGLEKSFDGEAVLSGIDLEAAEGETLVLLGRSGSGKTTLLRLIAGFETCDAGRVLVGGQDVTALSPARRRFGMVFQHYALFPHLSVAENVAFGLAGSGRSAGERRRRVEEMLAAVELPGLGDRRIDQISGGQQQRVALARALAPGPRVLLLDEPLSNLDPALRERTRRQLGGILRSIGVTSVWVTHEQLEAFEVGDRVALLEGGRLAQVGTAQELYDRPVDPFVAAFVGRASWLEGRLSGGGGVVREGVELPWALEPAGSLEPGSAVRVLARPEHLALRSRGGSGSAGAGPGPGRREPGSRSAGSGRSEAGSTERRFGLAGTVATVRFAGAETVYGVELADGTRLEVAGRWGRARPGEEVEVVLAADAPPLRAFPVAGETAGDAR